MISRRTLLKAAGAAAAAAASADQGRAEALASPPAPTTAPPELPAHDHAQAPGREPLESLTAEDAALLTAIVARLIPADANGPGAVEAGAVAYIDRALAGSPGLVARDISPRARGPRTLRSIVARRLVPRA